MIGSEELDLLLGGLEILNSLNILGKSNVFTLGYLSLAFAVVEMSKTVSLPNIKYY